MSVISLSLSAAFLGMLLMLSVAMPATAAQLIRHANDLNRVDKIKKLGQAYDALVGAQVVYDNCETKLPHIITPDKKAYLADKLVKVTRQFQDSYQQEYVARVKAPATATFLEDVAQSISARQQKDVNNMTLFMKQNRCGSSPLKPILKYVDDLQAQDKPKTPAAVAPVALDPFAQPQ